MTRWKLTIEYKGSDYAGWQRQRNAPGIQQAVEDAIEKFCGQRVKIQGAGRTDAGVHAWGQIAHFDLDYGTRPLSGFNLAKAINAHLRHGICVIRAEEAADDFHARFNATNKLYRYRIISRSAFPAIEHGLAWHIRHRLDIGAMQEAARHFIGCHDFTSFRAAECQSKSPVKTLDRLSVTGQTYDAANAQQVIIEAESRSFLHHQVRNIVGTLSLVGLGKWQPADVKTALEARDRTRGGPTAPPEGLYLVRIDY